ncbi:MAG: glycogen debranching enzyme GlgX [Calditrichaeota bacterium]|nr:MAG: glycogen debranching enzyme GlgX [Calditrichota bacterium]
MGVHERGNGVNFSIFSRHATRMWLEFYNQPGDALPSQVFELDPEHHRTGDIWHIWVENVKPGQLYAYRADGPFAPRAGHRFNRHKLLLDPYAKAITHAGYWDFSPSLGYDPQSPQQDLSFSEQNSAGAMPKCVVTFEHFDWEEDRPLRIPWSDTVIYETHIRGLTRHPSSKVKYKGTYRGLIEKIPYLQSLGVTAVELMPIHEFNEHEIFRHNPLTGEKLKNYWGYNSVGFFAPKGNYCSCGCQGQQKLEFKEMVKALHKAGVEVILDVVLNHTAEGNQLGPTLSFRGLDNRIYYLLADNLRYYKDFSGTGNSINAHHPVVRDFILNVLRYWVLEMHVDGFRFDLASVLGRDSEGNLLPNAPLLERIAEDPILRDVKLIAEAWDAAGAYQVGRFSKQRWAEWNGRFRDDVRKFWRGDPGMVGLFASRIAGSSDLYQHSGKGPESSINFITSHDGFTLNDLVSYREKHNEANGENNLDGTQENYSENFGVEGETDNPKIEALRTRQIKNFLLTLFISRGVPMLLGGDEFRRTQQGNNNAYCQDNEISWYDWRFLDRYKEIFRFTQSMMAFRKAHPILRKEAFYTAEEIQWFSPRLTLPDWFDANEKTLACRVIESEDAELYLMFNAYNNTVAFLLPGPIPGNRWHRVADTSLPSPEDYCEPGKEKLLQKQTVYHVHGRSSVILLSRKPIEEA